jgi:DNA-binding response OmpR family regulator
MTPPSSSPPRILVVEDDLSAQAMLRAWLHTEGCVAEVRSDTAGAREALESGSFDLMICDLQLPDGEGTELVAGVKGGNEGLPVVFLTGSPTLESAMRSVRLRVAAYLVKPPDLDELRTLVQREVAAYRCRRAIAASRRRLAEWDGELVRLEQDASAASGRPVVGYLQVTIHQLAALLTDLDRCMTQLGADAATRAVAREVDLVQGLRSAVAVLERTRSHFKSKDLGDLRKDLELILAQIDGGEQSA